MTGRRTSVTLHELRAETIYRFIDGRNVHVRVVYERFGHCFTVAKIDRALRTLLDRGLIIEVDGLLVATADLELAA